PTTTTRPRPKPGSWSRTGDQSSDSGSYSSSFTSDSSYSCDSGPTSSDSDSDDNTDSGSVTDVSPLQSPNLPDNLKDFSSDYKKVQEKGGSKKTKFRHHSDGSTKKSKKESVRFEGVGLGVGINTPNVLGAPPGWNESEAQELSMLLKAVLEMDKTPKSLVQMPHTQSSRPTSAKSNLSTKSLPHKRMNMSFSNDRVRQIDRENQRLLQQIMNKSGVELQNTGVKSKSRRPFPSQSATSFNGNHQARLSHSALRRQRENRRIEIENMKILSRIDSTKPTREMTKEALLEDHYKLTRYGQQLAKTPLRRISAKSTSGKPSMSEASSLLSLYSNASSSKAGSKGRPIHTKKLGLEPPPRQPRPAWDDRW
ncbi:cilia- and flagella-associated protein 97-like, partial [Anneissia japonica]|uniref:cilia- and flagella-associated protein 97-like n=1 Tax=Anneissia japonica TaxID=1529436 RepID=UPI0014257FBA